MTTMIHLIAKSQGKGEKKRLFVGLADRLSALSERFWFALSFILFVVMGPFAVFAVLLGLFSLAKEQRSKEAAEPASLP